MLYPYWTQDIGYLSIYIYICIYIYIWVLPIASIYMYIHVHMDILPNACWLLPACRFCDIGKKTWRTRRRAGSRCHLRPARRKDADPSRPDRKKTQIAIHQSPITTYPIILDIEHIILDAWHIKLHIWHIHFTCFNTWYYIYKWITNLMRVQIYRAPIRIQFFPVKTHDELIGV